jgi:CubicO group peptidase (beta-lactamase class C family)
MKFRSCLISLLLLALTPAALAPQTLPAAAPESVGLSSPRLERLQAVFKDFVDREQLAGAVVAIMRGGKLAYMQPVGRMDVEKNLPMRRDTIFRLASMSKAVTSVAAVMLMEEGKLRLADPVSRFLPAFRRTSVAVPSATGGGRIGILPARREITIRDLLTHTAGISYGDGPAVDQYKAAGIYGWYLGDKSEPIAPLMERLAGLPFDAQPGERYVYGYNTDILGAVIEKASGMPLDQFFRTRIFEPLKMADSCFFLPAEKRSRLATVYSIGQGGRIVRAAEGGMGQGDFVDGPRACFSGGAGLLSTATDYARLLQMLLNGGELEGARILSPKSIEMMTVNQVGSLYSNGDLGFGLGFEVITDLGRAGRPGSVGEYSWGSAYYSRYFVNPKENLAALFLTQLIPAGSVDLNDRFRYLVYQAIVGPVTAQNTQASEAELKRLR